MSNPYNRKKTKNKNSQGAPTISNRGKIAVFLENKFNGKYLDIIMNKKQNKIYIVSITLCIK